MSGNLEPRSYYPSRVSGKLHDHSFDQPGFTAVYPHLDASFSLSKDRSALELVRLSEPL
jgi:hypothetical protein